jgi:hypothetical protein
MKIAVTLIDHITRSAVTEDGRHMVLAMRDTEANEIVLGIPSEQITKFIDLGARALSDSERVLHPGADPQARIPVTWWNLARGEPTGGFVLSLTFGSGGSLSFLLSQHMTYALLDTLRAHLESAPGGDPRSIGFG